MGDKHGVAVREPTQASSSTRAPTLACPKTRARSTAACSTRESPTSASRTGASTPASPSPARAVNEAHQRRASTRHDAPHQPHRAHRRRAPGDLTVEPWRRTMTCADCHRVPATVQEPGHLDVPPAELVFGAVVNAAKRRLAVQRQHVHDVLPRRHPPWRRPARPGLEDGPQRHVPPGQPHHAALTAHDDGVGQHARHRLRPLSLRCRHAR